METIKAIVFDIDGTLVDSVDLHAKAWQDAFHDFGHNFEYEAIRAQIGKGGDQLMPVFLSAAELKARGEALEKHRSALFKAKYLGQVTAFPSVRELFQRLKADGLRLVLASSAKADEIGIYKNIAHIADLVDAQTSADDVVKSKPHPDIFESAMEKLPGMGVSEVIVVGDTPYDAEAAGKIGLRTVGLLCGGFPESDLRQAGCIAIFKDPKDVLENYEHFANGMFPGKATR